MLKRFRSSDYNYDFDTDTGFFVRWGANLQDDPQVAPAPEILDMELSEGDCFGCKNCYKGNSVGKPSHHMTLDTFKSILSKFETLTQIAFGITKVSANPDFFGILEHCKAQGVVPNFTVASHDTLTPEMVAKIAANCGAVAVSCYDVDRALGMVRQLRDAGMEQVNLHFVLAHETFSKALQLLNTLEATPDHGVRAVVFLKYKPKGTFPDCMTPIKGSKCYKILLDVAKEMNIGIGFDSCSAPAVLQVADPETAMFIEPCESGCFSAYVNCRGEFFPCSFAEGEVFWESGISLHDVNSFQEVWDHERVVYWRSALLKNGRKCPLFDLD